MKKDTILVASGRHPDQHAGAVNTPVFHASTITHPTMEAWAKAGANRFDQIVYGRMGTPTTKSFEEAVAALEGAERAVAVSSGMAACAAAILAVVKGGDHILVPDSVYQPVRRFAEDFLKRFGVETTYYDQSIGAGIADLIQDNTSLLYLETPGSQTFEIPDIPAMTAVAKDRGILTALDNTWATPLLFRPLDHDVDMSINAATKYLVGHSDAMLGVVSARQELFEKIKTAANHTGNCPGADELYLGLRGIRTMGVRLQRHQENTLKVLDWFQAQPEVHRILYPALPSHPGHEIWKRDFSGASGLFSVMFNAFEQPAVAAFVDNLEHFLLGASFGGYESLILPFDPTNYRTVNKWTAPGPCIRFHIGLEDPEDLIEDLAAGLKRLSSHAS